MRPLVSSIVVAATVAAVCGTAFGEGITWRTSLDEALKASKDSGKLVMLTLYTDWCGFCEKLKQETWPAPSVIAKSTEFECVMLNPEKTAGEDPFDVGEYPRTVFLRSDGELVSEVRGFLPPDEFVKEMARAQENLPKLNEAEEIAKKLSRPEDDVGLAFKAGILYAEIGRPKEAIRWLGGIYGMLDKLDEQQRPEAAFVYGMSLAADLQYEKAIPVLRQAIKTYPEHPRQREARFVLALALAETDALTEARDLWAKLAAEKTDDWIGKASAHNVDVVDEMLKNR